MARKLYPGEVCPNCGKERVGAPHAYRSVKWMGSRQCHACLARWSVGSLDTRRSEAEINARLAAVVRGYSVDALQGFAEQILRKERFTYSVASVYRDLLNLSVYGDFDEDERSRRLALWVDTPLSRIRYALDQLRKHGRLMKEYGEENGRRVALYTWLVES